MNWIPVSERLPESDGYYLGCYARQYYKKYKQTITLVFFDKDDMWRAPGLPCVEQMKVTHWMPLPAPPEDNE